jgi:hypothetical protein
MFELTVSSSKRLKDDESLYSAEKFTTMIFCPSAKIIIKPY